MLKEIRQALSSSHTTDVVTESGRGRTAIHVPTVRDAENVHRVHTWIRHRDFTTLELQVSPVLYPGVLTLNINGTRRK